MDLRWVRRAFFRNPSLILGTVFVAVCLGALVAAPLLTANSPVKVTGSALQSPSGAFPFGTDHLGRDLLARVLYGARTTFFYTLLTLLISAVVASLIGGLGAYYGGRIDLWITAMVDALFAFPDVLIAVFVVATLGPGIRNALMAVGIGALPAFARMARGLVLSVRHADFVAAAQAVGAGDLRILLRHIAPNCAAPLLVFVTLRFATIVLTIAALGFLGLGAQPPDPELGALVADGRNYFRSHPHLSLIPGFVLGFMVLAINLFGDGLNDALAVRQK